VHKASEVPAVKVLVPVVVGRVKEMAVALGAVAADANVAVQVGAAVTVIVTAELTMKCSVVVSSVTDV